MRGLASCEQLVDASQFRSSNERCSESATRYIPRTLEGSTQNCFRSYSTLLCIVKPSFASYRLTRATLPSTPARRDARPRLLQHRLRSGGPAYAIANHPTARGRGGQHSHERCRR